MSITFEAARGVATLTFARPEKKNALTIAMYEALAAYLKEALEDDSVRAVLITGRGETFTAGNDLNDFTSGARLLEPDSAVRRFMRMLSNYEKPVVAAVNGTTVGIGVTLLLHCDLVYIAAGARFSLPFANLGLVPEFGSSLLLPLCAGRVRAAEMLLLGRQFSAEEAVTMGLANAVLPRDHVLARAHDMALAFNSMAPGAVRESKRLMRQCQAAMVDAAIEREFVTFGQCLAGPEAREAIAALLERRPPNFARTR